MPLAISFGDFIVFRIVSKAGTAAIRVDGFSEFAASIVLINRFAALRIGAAPARRTAFSAAFCSSGPSAASRDSMARSPSRAMLTVGDAMALADGLGGYGIEQEELAAALLGGASDVVKFGPIENAVVGGVECAETDAELLRVLGALGIG